MSRIETRVPTPLQQTSPAENLQNAAGLGHVAGSAKLKRLRKVPPRNQSQQDIKEKTSEGISQAKQVQSADIAPLRDHRRDQMVGEISQLIGKIETIEDFEGADEVSQLCKMMLQEQMRRLLMISGTQIDSDGLKGTA
jgi:hypothetical protein